MNDRQHQLLLEYVTSAEPELNKLLRNGNLPIETEEFDSLFSFGDIPEKLYRLLPGCISRYVGYVF